MEIQMQFQKAIFNIVLLIVIFRLYDDAFRYMSQAVLMIT